MKEVAVLRSRNCSYLKDYGNGDNKAKGTEKCVIKWKLIFEDYENCL